MDTIFVVSREGEMLYSLSWRDIYHISVSWAKKMLWCVMEGYIPHYCVIGRRITRTDRKTICCVRGRIVCCGMGEICAISTV